MSERISSLEASFMEIMTLWDVHGHVMNVPANVTTNLRQKPKHVHCDFCINVLNKRKKIHESGYFIRYCSQFRIFKEVLCDTSWDEDQEAMRIIFIIYYLSWYLSLFYELSNCCHCSHWFYIESDERFVCEYDSIWGKSFSGHLTTSVVAVSYMLPKW